MAARLAGFLPIPSLTEIRSILQGSDAKRAATECTDVSYAAEQLKSGS